MTRHQRCSTTSSHAACWNPKTGCCSSTHRRALIRPPVLPRIDVVFHRGSGVYGAARTCGNRCGASVGCDGADRGPPTDAAAGGSQLGRGAHRLAAAPLLRRTGARRRTRALAGQRLSAVLCIGPCAAGRRARRRAAGSAVGTGNRRPRPSAGGAGRRGHGRRHGASPGRIRGHVLDLGGWPGQRDAGRGAPLGRRARRSAARPAPSVAGRHRRVRFLRRGTPAPGASRCPRPLWRKRPYVAQSSPTLSPRGSPYGRSQNGWLTWAGRSRCSRSVGSRCYRAWPAWPP